MPILHLDYTWAYLMPNITQAVLRVQLESSLAAETHSNIIIWLQTLLLHTWHLLSLEALGTFSIQISILASYEVGRTRALYSILLYPLSVKPAEVFALWRSLNSCTAVAATDNHPFCRSGPLGISVAAYKFIVIYSPTSVLPFIHIFILPLRNIRSGAPLRCVHHFPTTSFAQNVFVLTAISLSVVNRDRLQHFCSSSVLSCTPRKLSSVLQQAWFLVLHQPIINSLIQIHQSKLSHKVLKAINSFLSYNDM